MLGFRHRSIAKDDLGLSYIEEATGDNLKINLTD